MNSKEMVDYSAALREVHEYRTEARVPQTRDRYMRGYNFALWTRAQEPQFQPDNKYPFRPFEVGDYPDHEWFLPQVERALDCVESLKGTTYEVWPIYIWHLMNAPVPITRKGVRWLDLWDAAFGHRPVKTYYLTGNGRRKTIKCPEMCSITKAALKDLENVHGFTKKLASTRGIKSYHFQPPADHGTLPEPVPGWFNMLKAGVLPGKWLGACNVEYAEKMDGYLDNDTFDALVEDWYACDAAARAAHVLPKVFTDSLPVRD